MKKFADLLTGLNAIDLNGLVPHNSTQKDGFGKDIVNVDNLGIIRQTLLEIKSLGIFEEEISKLQTQPFYASYISSINFTQLDYTIFAALIGEIRIGAQSLRNTLSQLLEPEGRDEHLLYVKLPETSDFNELSKSISDLHKIIALPLQNPAINEQVKILRGEPGSILLVISMTLLAITTIGKICDIALNLKKKYLENKLFETMVKERQLDNEFKDKIVASNNTLISELVDRQVRSLVEENGLNSEAEKIEALKTSINFMAKFYEKGGEINPSQFAPANIKSLFPSREALFLPSTETKQIGEGQA